MRVVGIPIPLLVAAVRRIPNPNLVRVGESTTAVEICRRDRVQLEALTIDRSERDTQGIKLALGDVLVDIPDVRAS